MVGVRESRIEIRNAGNDSGASPVFLWARRGQPEIDINPATYLRAPKIEPSRKLKIRADMVEMRVKVEGKTVLLDGVDPFDRDYHPERKFRVILDEGKYVAYAVGEGVSLYGSGVFLSPVMEVQEDAKWILENAANRFAHGKDQDVVSAYFEFGRGVFRHAYQNWHYTFGDPDVKWIVNRHQPPRTNWNTPEEREAAKEKSRKWSDAFVWLQRFLSFDSIHQVYEYTGLEINSDDGMHFTVTPKNPITRRVAAIA